ncbi:hypothetical protein BDQ94DRAFT_138956 [Aspergillus welwitschiae]|uniref:Uncharacterized protein n=1 Tax=Aspergillus welwitschiae TaxID=1341132 RepID=A0A3F3QB90_9EURO|nr:hypothetical protein BDQ94DRAFT_138956 [Aspergillus welwitschiae]RDH36389.1 hypothetical protein BDQ94DRAFT_138956 [Aspergillus welwitschiae]
MAIDTRANIFIDVALSLGITYLVSHIGQCRKDYKGVSNLYPEGADCLEHSHSS